ncbi:MAG: hypothetical protein M3Y23_06485, partial [Actinomycetota bacterium]|nr:hypothetical protein [Actinomycetota bacterium]
SRAVVRLKSSNRQVKLPKRVQVRFKYSMRAQTVKKTIVVRTTRKAKGKARITAATQGKRGVGVLKVVKARKRR